MVRIHPSQSLIYSFLPLLAHIIYKRIRDLRKCQSRFWRDLNYWDKNYMWLVAAKFCTFLCGQFLKSSSQKTDGLNLQKSVHQIPSQWTPPIFAIYVCSIWTDPSILCHEPPHACFGENAISLQGQIPLNERKVRIFPTHPCSTTH